MHRTGVGCRRSQILHPQQPMSPAVTGGVPSLTHPKSPACSHANDAVSPDFQYSFIDRMKSQTSGHPSTYSAGGTEPPSLFFVSNILVHSSLEKYGFSALRNLIF